MQRIMPSLLTLGLPGPQGETGSQGAKGDSGFPGLNGIAGPIGMKGYVAGWMNDADR